MGRNRRRIAAILLPLMLWAGPGRADAVVTIFAGSEVLEIPPSAIAEMEISESGGITDVFLRLMPGASVDLAGLAAGADEEIVTLRVCRATLLQSVARDRIGSGTIYIAGTTMVRAEAMRALWHGRASCDTLDPEVFGHGE
jgi:hypothetical protein